MSAVLGGVIVVLTLCAMVLNIAVADSNAARRLMLFESLMFGGLAILGVMLALCGLLQRGRRTSAAVFGLVLNLVILIVALAGLKWL